MLKLLIAAALSVAPASSHAMVCRAPVLVLRITLEDGLCRIGDDTAIRRDAEDSIECLLSNPQLRIITLFPDGRFSYLDTDTDALRTGVCTPD